ncbi:Aerobic glycerol-3-phosphate dehydrogenase [Serratia fonticola]|uniref:Aerobic glycerol-3-phosphate dehydrogenase n=2 Tax=Serratia fonticola TaxID=47917 RepID=A0A4U9WQN4_SERFO|nr:Aerobic glycerol-3-phosphate dehydrogenase [Serratia fonticola]
MTESLARRYARTYGSHSKIILANANSLSDLGEDFGHDLYEAELRYLVEKEWVVELDDALWRRTKLGMWLSEEQQARVKTWLAENAKPKALSLAS